MDLAIFLMLSPEHILLIAIVVLLIFGGKKIPELMRGLGGGIKEFKNATKDAPKEAKTDEKITSSATAGAAEESPKH